MELLEVLIGIKMRDQVSLNSLKTIRSADFWPHLRGENFEALHLAPTLLINHYYYLSWSSTYRDESMSIQSKVRSTDRKVATQEVPTSRNQSKTSLRAMSPATEFGKTLKDLLGKTYQPGNLSEEELFAATAYQLVFNRYGASVAQDFRSAFHLNMADKLNSERFSSAERATNQTFKFFVNSTILSRDEVKEIRTLAFNTAQLDDNLEVAWDSFGDTRAVTSFSKGEKLVQQRLEASGNAPITLNRRTNAKNVRGYGAPAERATAQPTDQGGQTRRSRGSKNRAGGAATPKVGSIA
jgi:hypothetical protein